MKFIITGTGRSGTKWCATVLRLAGIYAGHEQAFLDANLFDVKPVELGDLDGDCSYAAMPVLKKYPEKYKDFKKILVVRGPFSTAQSFCRAGSFLEGRCPQGLFNYITEKYPEILECKNDTDAALLYWYLWNSEVAQLADEVVQLEDLTQRKLVELVGVKPQWVTYRFDDKVNVNRAGEIVQQGRVEPELMGKVRGLADSFGYNPGSIQFK